MLHTLDHQPRVKLARIKNADRMVEQMEWMKIHNPQKAQKLSYQMESSKVMKDLSASLLKSSEHPDKELAEELIFAGSFKHYDALVETNVSVTSYCRVMEKQVRKTGDDPYRGIMHSVFPDRFGNKKDSEPNNNMLTTKKPKENLKEYLSARRAKKITTSTLKNLPKPTIEDIYGKLSTHTLLTEHRRKVMLRAMLDAPECSN